VSFRRSRYIAARLILVVIVALGVELLLFWPQARAHLQSVALLWQLNGLPVPKLARPFASYPLTVKSFTILTSQGPTPVILYMPKYKPNARGVVLVHGVDHLGIRSPRMVAFARSLAACGLLVLTPELPDIQDYHVTTGSIATIGDAANWLANTIGRPVGLMGLSFSGGLALMAAAEPQYAKSVSFVFAVGAHDSMPRVANFYVTGEDVLPNGTVESLTPHEYGSLVLEYENLQDFTQPADTEALRAALRARLHEDPALEQSLVVQFTPAQKVEYDHIIHTQQQDLAIAESSRKHEAELEAVSPHGHLQDLRVPVFLLHGRDDNIIPYAESEWLAKDLPTGTLHALLVSPMVAHVDMEKDHKPDLMDKWRLVHFLARVMECAEH
jgi:dienelactone hydrolase